VTEDRYFQGTDRSRSAAERALRWAILAGVVALVAVPLAIAVASSNPRSKSETAHAAHGSAAVPAVPAAGSSPGTGPAAPSLPGTGSGAPTTTAPTASTAPTAVSGTHGAHATTSVPPTAAAPSTTAPAPAAGSAPGGAPTTTTTTTVPVVYSPTPPPATAVPDFEGQDVSGYTTGAHGTGGWTFLLGSCKTGTGTAPSNYVGGIVTAQFPPAGTLVGPGTREVTVNYEKWPTPADPDPCAT
jgi:hypothetical protein